MFAVVRYFEWPDLERGSDTDDDGSTLLVFAAGPADGPGEETFQATVCTPDALAELVARDGVVSGRHFLFVESINRDRVEAFIRDRLRRISGDTWSDVAEKIGRLGSWEFEDYNEAHG
ncbi:Imm8 family immunity protein [Petropleomorpha daqingensis]|uniref:Immunity protein 8 n=1 Tax=Petropleomorpha daqingensis TaxID=2026353 RepID=A0A853CE53_9ACTN|nr:hypothetical protein [Petropleomorpha daqingensis]